MAEDTKNSGWSEVLERLPLDELKNNFTDYVSAWGEKTIRGLGDKLEGVIGQMGAGGSGGASKAAEEGAEKLAEGESPVKAGLSGAAAGAKEKVKETVGGGSGGSGGGKKFSNIVETLDVGVPISVAYNQWTQFQDWTDFMKKVENVEQESEEKINIKGQVFWSHRTWESTIIQQVPDEQIVWRSTGQKGHLDGAVTFHEMGPRLTRILAVVEYYPQGFMEKTGNIWRAVGRRVQVEFKRYARQVMTSTILDPDSVEGWRGEIRDSEVVRTHEEVVEEEQACQQEAQDEAQYESEPQAEWASEEEPRVEPAEEESGADANDEPVEEEPAEEEPVAEDEEPVYDEVSAEEDDLAEPVEEDPVAEDDEEPPEEEPVEEEEEVAPADEDSPAEEEPLEEVEEPAEEEAPQEEETPPAEEEKPAKSSRSRTTKSSGGNKTTSGASTGKTTRSTRSTSKKRS